MKGKKLTVLGSINADHVISVPYFSKPGETLTGDNYQLVYGGKGGNQAVAAARLGANVEFIGCVGSDVIGETMKNAFSQEGIDTTNIHSISQEMTGMAFIQVAQSGENSIVLARGANAHLDEKLVQHSEAKIAQSNYLLMQLETPISGVELAAQIAKKNGVKVVLNPAPAQILSDELLSLIDIITPNETEAEILTGVAVTDEQSAVKAASVFHDKGIETVMITLGAKGVFVSRKGKSRIIKGFCVQAIDTTAAGDTFNGGFVTALLEEKAFDEAIRFGQAAAAISVTKKGAQSSIPTRQETLEFLEHA
ncbi:ribokinase [Haemophilus influenzae 3655]|uniref:Ribokinase n=1 Tax=Haemophilus influenzae (strain NTHi 3655) TaxID=375177 RepID=A0A0H3PL56_HAEI3|nr:ribokinase [Haemophilus influenzae]EDJ92518.1 ribokinase [Haemophilus influenzae 3655]KOR00580.1 ribokinase [Haemophilus influenzae]MCC3182756.1 ribokinase [Haemophilus influenzae]MCK8842716.1 ribokinase [Haemophilus influenzae]MCK8919477.1 ribokinase [Haemophilus influenzae]